MKQKTLLITKDTKIGDIVNSFPETIETLMEMGVHCVGCDASPYESLEEGFKGHGKSDKEIRESVEKLNKIIMNAKPKKEDINMKNAKLKVTKNAATKLKELIKKEKKQGLRISVVPGGCSGFKYGMEFSNKPSKDEVVIEDNGVKIFVDKQSIEKIQGSSIDYLDSLQGAGFKIENPNATKSCGCGNSFR